MSQRWNRPGRVFLVGAGPGDPDLITVRGLRCLQQAEVLVYDRLGNETLLDAAPAGAQRIFAGEAPGVTTLSPEEISALLVEHGRAGKIVVRLKSGDPYAFGRGGEEAEALRAAGVPFEMVPGVTAAFAAPAAAGIPVTHRDYTAAVTIVASHEDARNDESAVPWATAAAGADADTLVLLMGVAHLQQIAATLIASGRSPSTPVAVVRRGTWPDQQVVHGTLADIAARVQAVELKPPAVTVVGRVAALGAQLGWSGTYPLAGKRVLVTRAREQAGALSALLHSFGAEAVEYPAITIAPLDDYTALDAALAMASAYDWACFTSVNAVDAVGRRLAAIESSWKAFAAVRLAAIGPATAQALTDVGCTVAYTPQRFLAEEISAGLPNADGARILLARADIADARLVEGLRARGAVVDQYPAYRTLVGQEDPAAVREQLARGLIDVVTFASSSTVRNLCQALGDQAAALLAHCLVACIGPVTAGTAQELGLEPAIVATEHTIPGLVRAVWEYLARCTSTSPS
jgi:uroporphyrinogen III methyltransferase/synthase